MTTLAATAGLVVGCGSSDKPAPKAPVAAVTNGTPDGTTKPVAPYDPKIVPSKFSTTITNRYWPLTPGRTWIYAGLKDGVPERVQVTVTRQSKTILGVACVVVSDIVTSNHTLTEKTVDWYAQDHKGNVWYFGEDTKEYKNGIVTSTHGTWEAGVDNAKPGVAVQGHPAVGVFYRQEYRPGQAEDQARIMSVSATEKVPAGTYHGVVQTRDIDPLNPDKVENKWYARGVGPVHVVRIGSAHKEETKLISMRG
jgi:hypothetical protein